MKKIVFTLAVLLLAAPAMATVTITLDPGPGPNDVTVGFTSDEGQLVRAIALDVQVADPNVVIVDINCVSTGYKIHPGSINIDAGGNVTDYGTCAGTDLDSNSFASEQGSLYVGAANEPAPGDLFIITLGGCTANDPPDVVVSVSENVLRGGIVMEDAGAPTAVDVSDTQTVTVCSAGPTPCPCIGDVDGNGWLTTGDISAAFNLIAAIGSPYYMQTTVDDCGDVDLNGWLTTGDISAAFNLIAGIGSPYYQQCP